MANRSNRVNRRGRILDGDKISDENSNNKLWGQKEATSDLPSPNRPVSPLDASDSEMWTSLEVGNKETDEESLPSERKADQVAFSPRRSKITKTQVDLDPLSKQLNEFYENRVRLSLERKEICEEIAYNTVHRCLRKIQSVDDRFRANSLISHGIPYDGLQAEESIQLDMMVQLPFGASTGMYLAKDKSATGVRIQPQSTNTSLWSDCMTRNGYIAAAKVNKLLRKFFKKAVSVLQMYIKERKAEKLPKALTSVRLEEGPTIRLTVNKDIAIDILPAFVIPDSRADLTRRDVPSSSHVVVRSQYQNELVWKFSFYVAEKNRIRALGGENCRIQLLRILQEIRDNEDTLKPLSSYHLKTLLFHQADALYDSSEWTAEKISARFFDLLHALKVALKNHELKDYFMHPPEFEDVNLFASLDGKTLSDMMDVIEDISEHPMEVLATEGKQRRMSMWPWEYDFVLPIGK